MWFLGDVLFPFIAGSAIAYLLDPLADRLERLGCSRLLGVTLITVSALLVLVGAIAFLIPVFVQQLSELVAFIPEVLNSLKGFLQEKAPNLIEPGSVLIGSLENAGEIVSTYGIAVISKVFSSAMGALNILLFILIVPVVMVYMLADWDHAVAKVDSWLPRDHAHWIRELVKEVDTVLAGFVRGQLTVCAILAVFYAVLLMIVGLPFGLAVGCIAGLVSFIPFVGALGGGALAIGIAVFEFWSEPWWILVVTGIFFAGQMLEGNFLTPKLVGRSIGLHPVWLLFALSVFGALFGFVGMLIAVPAAAAAGVFFRFGIRQYLNSNLYKGRNADSAE